MFYSVILFPINFTVLNEIESNAVQNASTTSELQQLQQEQEQQLQQEPERQQQLDSITSTSNNNNNNGIDETMRTTTSNAIYRDTVSASNTRISQVNATTTTTTTATATTTTATENSDSTNSSAEVEGVNNNFDSLNKTDNNGDEKAENKPKSCLSRHNSSHISIKKRVNISTHAEIIEPDPLMPILLHSASLGDDEDEVFSDSMPPPKRDSMCAPYIERLVDDDDLIAESLAYCHGLPEWFNNERINDV